MSGAVRESEPMTRHTTYRIGGPAAVLLECDTVADLMCATTVLSEEGVDWTVLGKGSNVLVSDTGYEGAVLVLGKGFKRHAIEGEQLRTGAGVILGAVVQDAFKAGLSGLEFAVGIPGTVGGALAMNAGSRDEWIGSIVESVTLFVPGEGLVGVRGPEIAWAYRRTDLPSRGIVVEAVLRVTESDAVQMRRSMEASLRRRKRSQPLGMPSAGSVFVNPDGDSAGRLVESAGLKGARVGGAHRLRGARELHRQHRWGDGNRCRGAGTDDPRHSEGIVWHRTQAGNPVPRVVRLAASRVVIGADETVRVRYSRDKPEVESERRKTPRQSKRDSSPASSKSARPSSAGRRMANEKRDERDRRKRSIARRRAAVLVAGALGVAAVLWGAVGAVARPAASRQDGGGLRRQPSDDAVGPCLGGSAG